MALFSRKKEEKAEVKNDSPRAAAATPSMSRIAHVLQRPRITEKATMHQGESVYTFDVSEAASKRQILEAVRAIYKVAPRRVRIAQVPSKNVRNARSGKRGVKSGGKKAYIYLKKGDTINLT